MKRSKNTITLGSGKLFIKEYEKENGIPENNVIETEDNRIGWIKGGAEITYTPEFYTAEDDLGKVKKRVLQTEEALLKSGIMTWNGDTLKKLVSTGKTEEKDGKRITKIGGVGNYDGKSYVIRFLYEDPIDGNVRVTIVGQNTSGLTMTYAKDAETVIDAEFSALPLDEAGTLIVIEEETSTNSSEDNSTAEEGATV